MTPHGWRHARRRDRSSLLLAAGLTAGIFLLEVAGGLWSGSLALLADAGHVLTDLLALILAWTAAVVASRPGSPRRTWGYHRVEILSALVNGGLLALMAAVILWEAVSRLRTPSPVAPAGMLAVAGAGLVANLAGVAILSRASGSLNVKAALWHMLGDTLSSVGVILAGLLIALTGEERFDPLVSILIAGVILYGAVRIIREASDILLESVPAGLDQERVAAAIGALEGVVEVHDLHIWSITTGMPALAGHVVVPDTGCHRVDEVLVRVRTLLKERFQIEHCTIQVESERLEKSCPSH